MDTDNTDTNITPHPLDLVRAEIRRVSQIVIQLSAKEEDLLHALHTLRDEKRKWSLELMKLDARAKEIMEGEGSGE